MADGSQPLTLPLDQRPAWLNEDGIVMAGSWEPLMFRVRRDGSGFAPTDEQRAGYAYEQSPEMIAELKALGVNFVMIHGFKGFGLQAERESMRDAARFARLCREAGLRVGVYVDSGTMGWELLFQEVPEAREWAILDAAGQPKPYFRHRYRSYWNRMHPDVQALQREVIRFAIQDMGADLLHYDNFIAGPGTDRHSLIGFRQYLRQRFSPQELLAMGASDVEAVGNPGEACDQLQPTSSFEPLPPISGPGLHVREGFCEMTWRDYSCQWMADSFYDLTRYARTLRPDILMECNPAGLRERITPPVDHGRLLQGGEAFWDEGTPPGLQEGVLHTRIRTYKLARRMDNIAFAYTTTPLEAAEAMAFNRDSLGCVAWFEYGRIVARFDTTEPVSQELPAYIRFFNTRRDLFGDVAQPDVAQPPSAEPPAQRRAAGPQVVADVAILRSFPSQVFAPAEHARLTARVEQACIEQRIPFQIIYQQHLDELHRYQALVLAGCVALSDSDIAHIRQYVADGGRLCIIGPAATHDEWMNVRSDSPLSDLPPSALVRIPADGDAVEAIRRACPAGLATDVQAPHGVCAELTQRDDLRLLHLVNYRMNVPAERIPVMMRVPEDRKVERVLLATPGGQDDLEIAFAETDGRLSFVVPAVDVYAVVSVRLE